MDNESKKIFLEIKDDYCTGNYTNSGGGENWIKVDVLPTKDITELKAHKKLADGTLEFDAEKYNEMIEEQQAEKLAVLKSEKIIQSKQNLRTYLQEAKLTSDCHGKIEKQYSVTSEKQQHLVSMILKTQMAQVSGLDYKPGWNASGEESTYDWTLEELTQLAFGIEVMVRPLVSKQQSMEVAIRESTTIDELNAIDITFADEE